MFELMNGILAEALIVQALISLAVSYAAYYIAAQFVSPPDDIRMPKVGGFPLMGSTKGNPITKIYGRKRVPGNVIWCGPPVAYEYATEQEVESGKGGGDQDYYTIQTKYRRSFLIAFCEGPGTFIRLWKGKKQLKNLNPSQENSEFFSKGMMSPEEFMDLGLPPGRYEETIKTWTSHPLTVFEGNGNVGISDLTGEDYGDYPNLCCIFFEDYELGGTQAIPNFSAEIESAIGLEDKILIYDLAGLQAMNNDLTADYALMTDLDATDTINWNGGEGFVPIGPTGGVGDKFTGTLDGRNHIIDDLYIDATYAAQGLFGYVDGGQVSNLKVTNVTIDGVSQIGFMVGNVENSATFTDCFASGSIVNGSGHYSAGFVGRSFNDCLYTRCAAVGSIDQWDSGNQIGGFVGVIDGNNNIFTDCYARVAIARTGGDCKTGLETGSFVGRADSNTNTYTNCYAAASIQYQNSCWTNTYDTRPASYIGGGFFGLSIGGIGTLSSCYWDTEEGSSIYPDAAKFATGFKNARQEFYLDAPLTDGHYHITHDGHTTGEIAWNAVQADVETALNAALGADETTVLFSTAATSWGNAANRLKIMFKGPTYGYSPQVLATFDMTAATPNDAENPAHIVVGVAPLSDANITSKTTAQMQTQATFIGWDFDTVWFMGDSDYPELLSHSTFSSEGDMNPADIIQDIIENTRYGAGRSDIVDAGSFLTAHNYWQANDMLISITLDSVKPWQDWVDYILSHVGGYRFSSGGKMHLGVLRLEDSAFTLTYNDLLQPSPDADILPPKVNIKKRSISDTFNRVELNWTERANKYYNAVAIAYDGVDQAKTGGTRKTVVSLVGIHNSAQAKKMAYRFLVDGLYRFSFYTFSVGYKCMLLEVGDVGTISDDQTISNRKIRIMNISEESNGRGLDITAMDDYVSLYPDITYQSDGSAYVETPDITLGDATINFREDVVSATIHLSCSPAAAQCNGGFVYRSYDDIRYGLVGRYTVSGVTGGNSNSVGTTDGFIPAHPAVTWAANEYMLVDIGTVTDLRTDITDEEYWNDQVLAKIGDEIIAFKTAVETATTGIWQISNLRRGLFGTDPVAHYSGEDFCTLMPNFSYEFDPTNIGRTLYFKVVTYYGDNFQTITDVSAFSVTLHGYHVRPAAASLLRLTADVNDGGGGEYSGASFNLYWNLCSRTSGYGVGGYDTIPGDISWSYPDSEALLVNGVGVLYGNYIQDAELQAVVLKFEQPDGTAIGEREIAVSETATITKATDLGGFNPARIKVIPRRALYAWDENTITVDDGT